MDRVALITGASAGIGWATAARLAATGWSVVGASRRGIAPVGCLGLSMDVDDDASVRHGVQEVLARYGRVDALVSCAGWGVAGAVELTPLDDARAQLETNFWGTVRAAQAVLPTMRAQGSGHLVVVSSIGGVIGLPFQAYYSASKFALEGWAEALAYEVAPLGIQVSLVQPGNVRTEFTERRRVVGSDVPAAAAYAEAQATAIAVMARDERNGVAPETVATTITRLVSSTRPPRRVSVGKVSERVGVVAKRLLPFRVFEAAARSSRGVGRSRARHRGPGTPP